MTSNTKKTTDVILTFEPKASAQDSIIRVSIDKTNITLTAPQQLFISAPAKLQFSVDVSLAEGSIDQEPSLSFDEESSDGPLQTGIYVSDTAVSCSSLPVAAVATLDQTAVIPSPSPARCLSPALPNGLTRWPAIGGDDLNLGTAEVFASKAYKDKYQPGTKREIYIAGCPGLSKLKKTLEIPIFKIGECGGGRIATRLKEQGKDQYGSVWYDGDNLVQDKGYDKYSSMQIEIDEDLHENSPVEITKRGLVVTLPAGMSEDEFSRAFLAKLASCSWSSWQHSEEAKAHFLKKNINPAIARRFTSYQTGSSPSVKEATEFYCIRNSNPHDCRRLIAVIENVVIKYLGLR